jgi:HD-GYP domain-containing protein (c-di-GMP phosphodiesterase class II)
MGGFKMIALPQCLEFPYDDRSREICDYYLQILEIKNKSVFMHSKQVANYSASIAAKIGLPPAEVACIKLLRCFTISDSFS